MTVFRRVEYLSFPNDNRTKVECHYPELKSDGAGWIGTETYLVLVCQTLALALRACVLRAAATGNPLTHLV